MSGEHYPCGWATVDPEEVETLRARAEASGTGDVRFTQDDYDS